MPASTLTVLTTVVVTYYLLGFLSGNEVAGAAKWTAVFSANIHFALIGTDYLGSQLPPSPLQHMWSLGVEAPGFVADVRAIGNQGCANPIGVGAV